MKKLSILLATMILSIAWSINLFANDTIRMVCNNTTINFEIIATYGKTYRVDWGDGTISNPLTGSGNNQQVTHNYSNAGNYTATVFAESSDCFFTKLNCFVSQLHALDVSKSPRLETLYCTGRQLSTLDVSNNTLLKDLRCDDNLLSSLDISNNTQLTYLDCDQNQLSSLNIGNNTQLTVLSCDQNQLSSLNINNNTLLTTVECYDNRLQLSDLYAISQQISVAINKPLGTQQLPAQVVMTNNSPLFSSQTEFGGVSTVFNVKKGNVQADSAIDYIVSNGLVFLNADNYTVTMTNAAIVSRQEYPAKVIAEITVLNAAASDASLSSLTVSEGTLTPAFNSSTFDYSVNVENSVSFITITAVANDPNATVIGDGVKQLNVGANPFKITVTAEDDITELEYNVDVIRANEVSIAEYTINGIEIYPNPATTHLYVKLAEPQTADYSIYNIVGQVVKQGILQDNNVINVTSLVQGTYFLKITGATVKFVKI